MSTFDEPRRSQRKRKPKSWSFEQQQHESARMIKSVKRESSEEASSAVITRIKEEPKSDSESEKAAAVISQNDIKKEPRDESADVKHKLEKHFTLILPADVKQEPQEIKAEPHELRISSVRSEAFVELNVKQEPEENFTLVVPSDLKQEDTEPVPDIKPEELVECEYSLENDEYEETQFRFSKFDDADEQEADEDLYPCEHCNQTLDSASQLIDHFRVAHRRALLSGKLGVEESLDMPSRRVGLHQYSDRPRQYLCDICGKTYTQSSHLWQHLRFHNGVKPFKCSVEGCDRNFTINPDLKDHIRKCHTGERPYLCEICNKRFLTGSVYYQHRLIHKGERRYGCEECGKRFYRADALKNHVLIHSGEKPYACSECDRKFRQRGDRDKHFKIRHPTTPMIKSPTKKLGGKTFGQGHVKNNTGIYSKMPPITEANVKERKEAKIDLKKIKKEKIKKEVIPKVKLEIKEEIKSESAEIVEQFIS